MQSEVAKAAKKATLSRQQSAAVRAEIDAYLKSDEFRQLVWGEMRLLAETKVPGQVARIAAKGKAQNQLELACLQALKEEVDGCLSRVGGSL
jgi:hypothetical protein